MIDIRTVGLAPSFVPYHAGWDLQRRTHAEVASGRARDTLLLLEHEAVYTAGARTLPSERPTDGTAVVDVDRGGKITWHGPGQLVGYPIVRLPDPVDVVAHVRRIEDVLVAVLRTWGIDPLTVPGRSGVWVRANGRLDKIAAVGVRVERATTMHGFAVNCSNSLDPFSTIVPCGITDAGVTSLSAVLGAVVTPAAFAEALAPAFASAYGVGVAA